MHKKNLVKVAGVGLASAALATTLATSAQATTVTATVSVAGSTSGSAVASRATSIGSIAFTASAAGGGSAAMSCTSVVLPGSVTPGATDNTTTFATIDHTRGVWTGCTGVGLHLAVAQNADWHIGITGANYVDSTSGHTMTPGIIPDVDATVSDTDAGGTLCQFRVHGSVTGTFDNNTQELDVTGSSLITNIDPNGTGADCLGALANPGTATFTGAFDITNDPASGTPTHLPVLVSNP
jgi:hypothetical protein